MHEDTPILMQFLGYGEAGRIDIENFLDTTERETVGFEVAFAALVATVVLSAPPTQTPIDTIATWAVIGLLILTLARLMSIDELGNEPSSFMQRTMRYMLFLTFIGSVYVGFSMSTLLSEYISTSLYPYSGILIFVIAILPTILYELIFGDFFLWISILIYNEQVDKSNTSVFYNGLLSISRETLNLSPHPLNKDHPVIAEIYSRDLGEVASGSRIVTWTVFGIVLLMFLFLFILISLPLTLVVDGGIATATATGTTMFLGSLTVTAILQFIYARYGNTSFDEIRTNKEILFLMMIVYGLVWIHALG